MDSEANIGGGGGDKRVGPCGACKFLRRKCVKGCIFAPYFDSDEGTAHFSAVHKVFGASNASKLLLGIPAHERLAAVVTLCYEALARARDPVYGCVAHIFALQQQIANLQAELANVQARLSTLQAPPLAQLQSSSSPTSLYSFSDMASITDLHSNSGVSTSLEHLQAFPISVELSSFLNISDQHLDNGNLQDLAQELVSRYLAGARFRPANSN